MKGEYKQQHLAQQSVFFPKTQVQWSLMEALLTEQS